MRIAFALILVVHGLIHLLGFAKAFGLAALPQLTEPVSRPFGALWLLAAGLFILSAVALFAMPRWWWAIGAVAIAVSMVAIASAWSDAKYGALANVLALAGVVVGFALHGPGSLRAEYDRDVHGALAPVTAAEPVTEADLARLPPPVREYLRVAGVVGRPRVRNFRARMHGRIRSGPEARWMPFTAEQHNVLAPPARLFYMRASMFAVPAQGYHRYVGSAATMRVKAAGLVTLVDASGPEMNQGETVTMLNDMCVMAPATLIDPSIAWEAVDDRTARARFTNAGVTVGAELSFNDRGELVNFRSGDRYRTSPDGRRMARAPWSTPLGAYRPFAGVRLASAGEGRWHEPGCEFTYIELTLDEVRYNVRER
jgi:uncharacterized membrane protein YphA (DoxX/SURF4 family)